MRNMRAGMAGILFLFMAVGAGGGETPAKSAFDKATLEAFVRHLLIWGPQIKVQVSDPEPADLDGFRLVTVKGTAGAASQEHTFYISADGQKIVRAQVFDVKDNPFRKDFERITTMHQPSLGTPGAPVRMVLFTDFQCPFCAKESEMLRKNLIQAYPNEVRLYFKDFPLDSIHPWSRIASIAGRCVYAQSEEAFWKYHDWVFGHQNELTKDNVAAKAIEVAGALPGMDVLRLKQCVEGRETEVEVNDSIAEAQALGLNGTPTLFVNGRRIPSQIAWPNLKQVIDFELNYQQTAQNAGDVDCCAVKLPSPLDR